MKLIKWGNRPEIDTRELEVQLQSVYRPLAPRAEFVRKLRSQLVREFAPTQIQTRTEKRRLLWVIGASLVGGVLAIFMGVRTILTLAAALGLLLELKRETSIQKALPVRQVE